MSDLEDEYELEFGSFLTEQVRLVLASPPYNTRSPRGQSNSAHYVFSKCDMENVVRLMGNRTAPVARGRIVCSDLLFYH